MGDKNSKRKTPMRSIMTLAVAGLLAVSAIAPASAVTRHHARAAAPAPYQSTETVPNPQAAAHPDAPAMVRDQANSCFTDEGYGRFASCDGSGF
jgi:hypothetical protein